jgi:hypothetical protein
MNKKPKWLVTITGPLENRFIRRRFILGMDLRRLNGIF